MSLGTKIRSAVNAVGSKSKSIGRIGHKAGKFVGKFDKSAGAELNELADDSAMAGSVAKDIGHIGTDFCFSFHGSSSENGIDSPCHSRTRGRGETSRSTSRATPP